MAKMEIEILWKDRRRRLGLPLSFTRYSLSEDRLFLSTGFFNIKDDEILLYRVRDIATSRNIIQRMFGVGTVTVTSSDKSLPTLVMKNVKNPVGVKELIHECVEEMKIRRRVRVGEIISNGDEGHDCCHHDGDGDGDIEDDLDYED